MSVSLPLMPIFPIPSVFPLLTLSFVIYSFTLAFGISIGGLRVNWVLSFEFCSFWELFVLITDFAFLEGFCYVIVEVFEGFGTVTV